MSLRHAANSLLVAAVIGGALFSTAAWARNDVFTARLAAPAAQSRVIALNAVWNCSGDTCVARPNHAATVRACRQFVNAVGGAVTAYGSASRQLSADELARCNS